MKIIWDNRNGMPKLIFEEKDLLNAIYIQEMIKGESICRKCGTIYESKGWEVLKEYMECEKMKLEAKMESGIAPNKMIPEEKSQVQIALWKGFKHFMSLPERIIEQAEKIREDMRKQEEIKREARNDE